MSNTLNFEAIGLEPGDVFTTNNGDTLTALGDTELDPHGDGVLNYRLQCRDSAGEVIYWLFNDGDEVTMTDPEYRQFDDNDEDWKSYKGVSDNLKPGNIFDTFMNGGDTK